MKDDAKAVEKAKQEKQLARDRARHRRVYSFFKPLARVFADSKLKYRAPMAPEIEGNFLLLSNHNTDFDFILTGTRFKPHIYFVASEHVYQKGFASKLLAKYFAPIARVKGTTASSTVMAIIRKLRKGDNVCIFAEGNRSFNGLTCPILFSTGKLAKASGVSLVTYKLIGGYLTTPRWAYTVRKGRMTGEVVNIYSPEQLKSMTEEEVNDAIVRDLSEDAYARQREHRVAYRGKRLAEGLEHALYTCPECGKTGELHSNGDHLYCECGMKVKYDKYGMLHGCRFETVTEWDLWQRAELEKRLASVGDERIFCDENVELVSIDAEHNTEVVDRGELQLWRNSISVGKTSFPLNELTGLAIYGRCTMVFEHNDVHYEIRTKMRLCATKYVAAYEYLTSKA